MTNLHYPLARLTVAFTQEEIEDIELESTRPFGAHYRYIFRCIWRICKEITFDKVSLNEDSTPQLPFTTCESVSTASSAEVISSSLNALVNAPQQCWSSSWSPRISKMLLSTLLHSLLLLPRVMPLHLHHPRRL